MLRYRIGILAARDKGAEEGITDDEILQMLTTMVRQRKRVPLPPMKKGGRVDLAASEQEEIDIISDYLPKTVLTKRKPARRFETVIKEIEAKGLKDMGRTMAELKKRYAGQMDFSKASAYSQGKHLAHNSAFARNSNNYNLTG